jgi:hypothetical protein
VLVDLQDRVEGALFCFDFLMGDVFDGGDCGSEGFLGALVFLVDVHFGLPGVEGVLALVEDH